MSRNRIKQRIEAVWQGWRSRSLAIETKLASRFERCADLIADQSTLERQTWAWAALAIALTLHVVFKFEAAYLHALYLPLWLGAWVLDRRSASLMAIVASVWIYVAPWYAGVPNSLQSSGGKLATACMYVITTWLVGRLRDVYSREKSRARIDGLTGCLNTNGFYEAAEEVLASAREQFRPFALLYADIDDFKILNDTLGHLEADKALKAFGRLLKTYTRNEDLVARVGGDEFIVMLAGIGPDMAFSAAERLQSRIHQELNRRGFPISLSVGCIAFNEAPDSVQIAVQLADQMMYAAKKDGKAKTVTGVWPPHSIAESVRLGAIYAN